VIDEAALTRANRARTVSRTGAVWVFCGRFEVAVSGVCGARDGRLKLGAKRFEAEPGRPVLLKFVLSKSSMKVLRAARKVPMRGSVGVSDASGNSTTAAFGLIVKAPVARSR